MGLPTPILFLGQVVEKLRVSHGDTTVVLVKELVVWFEQYNSPTAACLPERRLFFFITLHRWLSANEGASIRIALEFPSSSSRTKLDYCCEHLLSRPQSAYRMVR